MPPNPRVQPTALRARLRLALVRWLTRNSLGSQQRSNNGLMKDMSQELIIQIIFLLVGIFFPLAVELFFLEVETKEAGNTTWVFDHNFHHDMDGVYIWEKPSRKIATSCAQ